MRPRLRFVNLWELKDLISPDALASPLQSESSVMYNVRYRVLKTATTIRNVTACVAFVAGSYLASGLVNASPVTQPDLTGPRSRAVLVMPAAAPEPTETQIARPDAPLTPPLDSTLTL